MSSEGMSNETGSPSLATPPPEPSDASAGSDGSDEGAEPDLDDTTGDDEMVAGEER